MTVEILGRREDQRLEFKSRETLDDPRNIARAVVGMLNASGGEIWIGVEEEDGVAVAVEPVHDPERAKERLRDHLLDVIDPSPTANAVSLELTPAGADPALLVVKVQGVTARTGRKPFALRKGGGWHFLRRAGARNHPMSRQEIFGSVAEREGDPDLEAALRKLEEARKHVQDGTGPGLWLGLQPLRHLGLDVQETRFSLIALEPFVTGNRRAGWHFAGSSKQPRLVRDAIEWGLGSEAEGGFVTRVEVTERGELRFWTALEHLRHSKGESREVGPTKILEYPISAFRIARVIYHGLLDPEDRVVANLALFGIGGWGLREGTPGDFFLGNDLARIEEPDLIWEPVVFTYREIDEAPDRCGFRLVRRVYQAFGWREEHMPRQYDREAGKLILPE